MSRSGGKFRGLPEETEEAAHDDGEIDYEPDRGDPERAGDGAAGQRVAPRLG